MKKICKITTALLFLLMVSAISAIPSLALTEGDWEFQLLDNEVMITGYLGSGGDVVVPETIFGVPVTEINCQNSDNDFENATSITFPKTLKTLTCIFWNGDKNNLKTVIFSEGTEIIGSYAFSYCKNLNSVKLPSTLKEIGADAFLETTSLKEIEIPSGVTKIEGGAFEMSGIEEIDLSALTCEYDSGIFKDCSNLKSAKLANITEVPSFMFYSCTSLEYVELPSEVETIGQWAFRNCTSLKSIVLPTSLKKIAGHAFYGCETLREVVIPYGTESIEHCFGSCTNLKSLYVPDTVTSLSFEVISYSDNCIIYCTAESKAAEVCKKNKLSYLTDKSVNSAITVLYNGTRVSFHTYDQNPELINDRTLVPLRSIFEAMGADVEWIGETSTVIATRNGVKITLQIGSNTVVKNNENITIDTPPMILNDRTMVPVRVIAEAFGADVQWNGAGKTVIITE